MFEPRTRRERVLLQAALDLARQLNGDLFMMLTNVAIAQSEEATPPAPDFDKRSVTYVHHVVMGIPQREDL